jgi:hypothetical protein
MKDNATPIQELIEKAENYGKTSLKLYKLQVLDQSSKAASSIFTYLVIIILVALSILFIDIGLALCLGYYLGLSYLGFLILAVVNGLIAWVIYHFRNKWIKYPIQNLIIDRIQSPKT